MQFRKINAIHATILAFLLAFTSSLILEKGFLDQKALLFKKYDLYICAVSISIDALICSFFFFPDFWWHSTHIYSYCSCWGESRAFLTNNALLFIVYFSIHDH